MTRKQLQRRHEISERAQNVGMGLAGFFLVFLLLHLLSPGPVAHAKVAVGGFCVGLFVFAVATVYRRINGERTPDPKSPNHE